MSGKAEECQCHVENSKALGVAVFVASGLATSTPIALPGPKRGALSLNP